MIFFIARFRSFAIVMYFLFLALTLTSLFLQKSFSLRKMERAECIVEFIWIATRDLAILDQTYRIASKMVRHRAI